MRQLTVNATRLPSYLRDSPTSWITQWRDTTQNQHVWWIYEPRFSVSAGFTDNGGCSTLSRGIASLAVERSNRIRASRRHSCFLVQQSLAIRVRARRALWES